jgi:NTE family protein
MTSDGRSAQPRAADERSALRNIPIFAEVDDEQLDHLARAVDRQYVPANEWLFQMGDPSDAIYVVASGRFAAVGRDGQVLREMASGESIGDLGVITGGPRSAGIRALRDGVVWRIAAETFTDVLAKAPQVQNAMFRAMAVMLRDSRSATVTQGRRVVAVLSTGDVAAAPIVDAIAARLGPHGQTAVVAPPVDTTAAANHYGELVEAFSETLDRVERSNDWVLLVADRGSGDIWRRYVVAQSDRLVILADRARPPEALDAPGSQRPVHLVTCDVVPDPSWWDLLRPVSHHPANADGIGALARRIAGRSLGLVLGGGGARGLAHYGVYEELTRAGVVIDRFGGTSSGALAAATFALGLDARDCIDAARKYIAETRPVSDYTLPAIALTRGRRVERLIEGFFGSRTLIEQLPREFFSVSTDIITGDQVVHRRGLLWVAVRTSISIPGLLPPVPDGERLLVDGGLLNILPADLMCADPDGEAICVDLRRTYVPSKGFGPLPTKLQPPALIRRLLTGTEEALPPLQETLLRSVELSAPKWNLRELPRVAAIIEPDVSAIGPLDFKNIDAALEAGRIAARAALEAQPALAG